MAREARGLFERATWTDHDPAHHPSMPLAVCSPAHKAFAVAQRQTGLLPELMYRPPRVAVAVGWRPGRRGARAGVKVAEVSRLVFRQIITMRK